MRIFILSLFVSLFSVVFAQESTVRGFVYIKASGEPAPYIRVEIVELKVGAMTDLNGFFSIPKVPKGEYTVKVSSVQFQEITAKITTGS